MNAVTIRVETGAAKRYQVSLLEGANVLAQASVPGLNVKALRKAVREKTGDPADLGAKLGRFLLTGAVGTAWTAKAPVRTYLDVRAPALESVPWELARAGQRILFLREGLPFAQLRAVRTETFTPEWGIRVLAIVAAKDEANEIGSREEARAIRSAVRPVNRIIDVMVREWPSRKALQEYVEEYRPHVLHVIGHGDEKGLLLYDGHDDIHWGPSEIEVDLNSWKWKPELVYLNTCSSGASYTESRQDAQWTVVKAFLEYGSAAVIAMLADVRGRLAVDGAAAFYAGLANGDTVDVALVKGRRAIALVAPGNEGSFEPYLPQLTVARPVEEILRHTSALEVEACPDLDAALNTFVDRDDERRKLMALLDGGKRAVVIEGDPEVGKSWLLQWCMDAWLRRKMEVRYVEISGCQTWLDVVRAIRDGSPRKKGCVFQGLSPEARALLNWRLNALARGVADPPASSLTGTEQEDVNRTNALVNPQAAMIDAHMKAMEILHAALQQEAGNAPLVVVLDNFVAGDVGLAGGYFSVLRDHWINNLVVRAPSGIRVVLGVKSSQLVDYGLQTLPDGFEKVPLSCFPVNEFAGLMLELLPLRYGGELGDKREKALKWLSKELAEYDPTETGQALNGAALTGHCDTIWKYCRAKRKVWEK